MSTTQKTCSGHKTQSGLALVLKQAWMDRKTLTRTPQTSFPANSVQENTVQCSSKTKPGCGLIVTARVGRKEHCVDSQDRDGKQARAAWLLSHICPSDHSQRPGRSGGLGPLSSGMELRLRPRQHKAIKGRN